MYQAVSDAFNSFSKTFEGRISYMYLDIDGHVTIGVGNLIDTVGDAQRLPFVHKSDDTPASQDEIRLEWQKVKARIDLARVADYLEQFKQLTDLKLTEDGIDQVVLSRLVSNETVLKRTSEFADLEDWPADAQLGLFSMAWALGAAGFRPFRDFRAACASKDWDAAGQASHMDDSANPGLTPRNTADQLLFSNASQVIQKSLDPSVLYYPQDMSQLVSVGPAAPTDPPVIDGLDPDSGSEGDTVVITGAHFKGAFSVGFGDSSVTDMNVDSDTQITVSVPAGSGNVPVTVETALGTSEPSSDAEFAYL